MTRARTPRAKNDVSPSRALAAAVRELGARLDPAESGAARAMRLSFGPAQPGWSVVPPNGRGNREAWTLSLSSDDLLDLVRHVAEGRRARQSLQQIDQELFRRSSAARRCGAPFAVVDECGTTTFETDAWRAVVGELELPASIGGVDGGATRLIAPDVTLEVEPIHDARGRRVGSIVRAVTTAPAPGAETPVEHVFRRAVCALEGALATRGVRVEATVTDPIAEIDGELEEFASELLDFAIEAGTLSSGETLVLELLRDPDPCVEARIPGVDGSARRIGVASSTTA